MIDLFGRKWTRAELERHFPDPERLFGIMHYTVSDGPACGNRVIRIEAGAGLRVDILPDRLCDIGAVWCNEVPFHWAGPMGAIDRNRAGGNTALFGLMQTCGFDHIRSAETIAGQSWPQHGNMLSLPATVLSARAFWHDEGCLFRIEAEAAQIDLGHGALKLQRRIDIPLAGRVIKVSDSVSVRTGSIPVMALYHVNLGFPFACDDARLLLSGNDITLSALDSDKISTRPSGVGPQIARLQAPQGAVFELGFDGGALPVFQVLRNYAPGTSLVCLEPATHERQSRATLLANGALTPLALGETREYAITLGFAP